MSEQAEFDPNNQYDEAAPIVLPEVGGEHELPEKLQQEALKLSLEEFHEGVMGDEALMGAVIAKTMAAVEGEDTSNLPNFTVKPYMGTNNCGQEERGLQVVLGMSKKMDSLPAISIGFGRFVHLIVLESNPLDANPKLEIPREFAELIAGRGFSKEQLPTADENEKILTAARAFVGLSNKFKESCEQRGAQVGIGHSGTPELISILERQFVIPSQPSSSPEVAE